MKGTVIFSPKVIISSLGIPVMKSRFFLSISCTILNIDPFLWKVSASVKISISPEEAKYSW